MEVVIYTTEGCFYCEQIKELCRRANIEYTSHLVGTSSFTQKDFIKKFPLAQGYPYVIIDGEVIGGLVETARLFVKKGLVSSGRK
tara:strand:- start:3103 stop:3357 length:255 start_codon:yes stop_codon:yes gene_type:complete